MFIILQKYMNSLTIEKLNALSIKNNIILSEEELTFSYSFIKKNWNTIISNPSSFNIDKYQDKFSSENFLKIKKIYFDILSKYSHFL